MKDHRSYVRKLGSCENKAQNQSGLSKFRLEWYSSYQGNCQGSWSRCREFVIYLNGIRPHDLCDTGAALYQLSYQANWELVTL